VKILKPRFLNILAKKELFEALPVGEVNALAVDRQDFDLINESKL